jgi:hypothetical protein
LPRAVLAAYALPALPAAMLGLPLLIYLPTYYAGATAMSLTAIGTVLLLARLWDVAIDPAIGYFSDHTRGPWGRRKPWMVAALPLVLFGSYMLFDPPADANSGYLLVWLLVVYLGWSMLQIPHQAWGAELSADYAERSRIAAWRESVTVAGVAIAASLPVSAPESPAASRSASVVVSGGPKERSQACASHSQASVPSVPTNVGLRPSRSPQRPVSARIDTRSRPVTFRATGGLPVRARH